jgi:hypothetical protein
MFVFSEVFSTTQFKKYVKNTILKPANYSPLLKLIEDAKDFEDLSNKYGLLSICLIVFKILAAG